MKVNRCAVRLLPAALAALWFAGSLAAQSSGGARPGAAGNEFLGSAACKDCHSEVWNNFYKTPHFKSVASGREAPADTGCEGCHGPGGNHVKSMGGAGTIASFARMTQEQVLDACLKCHSQTLSRANIGRDSVWLRSEEHTSELQSQR